MGSLAGYIALVCVTVVATYLSQFLVPKIKIRYWTSHYFLYSIPAAQQPGLVPAMPAGQQGPATFQVLTNSVTIQNLGRRPAEWVEVVHRKQPDFFQLQPPLNYTEATTPAGEHVLRVESIAPKEWFTIQFLSYRNKPELLYVRSAAGHAPVIPVMPVRKFPKWVYSSVWALIITGCGTIVYWIVRVAVLLAKLPG